MVESDVSASCERTQRGTKTAATPAPPGPHRGMLKPAADAMSNATASSTKSATPQ